MKKKKKRVLSIIELNHIEEVKVVWAKLNNGITCNQILEDLCLGLDVVKRYKESRYFYFDYLNEIATILAGKRTKIINDSDFKEYLDDEVSDKKVQLASECKTTYYNAHSDEYSDVNTAWESLISTKPNWTVSLI